MIAALPVSDDSESFYTINLTESTPDRVIQPSVRASFYHSLHELDRDAYPLSSLSFSNRKELYRYGAEHIHADHPCAWIYQKIPAVWHARHPETDQRHVCALIINEMYEPRFGTFFCPNPDAPDIVVTPVPCFLNCHGYGCIRYCGTWKFRRVRDVDHGFMYCAKGRPRSVVYEMFLECYDERWGTRL